ncbi:MAG: hypothetical protein QG620_932 [Patescibacteria group bacterium]|nr:hypothetical protein [Patescibacteria group bacterium]
MRKAKYLFGKIFIWGFWQDVLAVILRPLFLLFFRPGYVFKNVSQRLIRLWRKLPRIVKKLKRITNSCFVMIRHPLVTIRSFWRTPRRRIIFALTLIFIIVLPAYFLMIAKKSEAAWWNDSWRYRKKLTIDSDQVAGELQNFPMLVSLTDTDLSAAAQSSGNDIVFTDSLGTKLSHEIESYTSATGVLVAWVKIPNLTDSHDMDLYMYYGNSTAQSQQQPTDVWDENFKMVQHMNQDPSGTAPQMLDSSENNNDGTSGGTMLTEDLVDAKIGKGLDFDGGGAADDYINAGTESSIDNLETQGGGGMTMSAWIYPYTLGENSVGMVASKDNGAGSDGAWSLSVGNYGGNVLVFHKDFSDTNLYVRSSRDIVLSTWQNVVVSWNGGNSASSGVKFYIDGQETSHASDTDGAGGANSDANQSLYIGNNRFQTATLDGLIDNIRISNMVRSSEWIETEYNNQNNTSTFLSVNSKQQERPGLPAGFWPFNEGYGTTAHDESGGGNDGTITGATWQQESECVSGKCLKFDGSGDEVDAGDVSY